VNIHKKSGIKCVNIHKKSGIKCVMLNFEGYRLQFIVSVLIGADYRECSEADGGECLPQRRTGQGH